MTKSDREKLRAVSNGMITWAYEHPVSMFQSVEDGVHKALADWLNKNSELVLKAVAREPVPEPVDTRWPKPDGVRTEYDDGADKTPAELRESAYRRGMAHGLQMALDIVAGGGGAEKLRDHMAEVSEWRLRQNQYAAIDRAEVRRPPWPPEPPGKYSGR